MNRNENIFKRNKTASNFFISCFLKQTRWIKIFKSRFLARKTWSQKFELVSIQQPVRSWKIAYLLIMPNQSRRFFFKYLCRYSRPESTRRAMIFSGEDYRCGIIVGVRYTQYTIKTPKRHKNVIKNTLLQHFINYNNIELSSEQHR